MAVAGSTGGRTNRLESCALGIYLNVSSLAGGEAAYEAPGLPGDSASPPK